MAFHEIRLNKDISYGSTAEVEYMTSIIELPSRAEQRQSYSTNGRKVWRIKKENLSRTEMKELQAFFRARKGKFYGFRLLDLPNNDYKVEDEYSPLLTGTTLQLIVTYPDALNPEIQKITKPILAADVTAEFPDISLKRSTTGIGGTYTAFSSGGNWSIDRTTGIITFTADQTGNHFKWSGAYDFPVRFDTDIGSFQREAMDIHNMDINLIELKY